MDGYFRWCDCNRDREGIFRRSWSKLESRDHCPNYSDDVLCFPNEYVAAAAELLYVPTRRHFIGDLFFSLSDRSEDSLVIGYVFGYTRGSLGETCALALLLGGVYLVVRKVISPIIPLCLLEQWSFFSTLLGGDPLYQMMSGGLLLGAIFMATDYTTSPITRNGKIILGLVAGLLPS